MAEVLQMSLRVQGMPRLPFVVVIGFAPGPLQSLVSSRDGPSFFHSERVLSWKMAGSSKRKEKRGFFWTILSMGLAWTLFCHVAPIIPQGRLISFSAGMAPPLLLLAPTLLIAFILCFRAFRKPAWGALQAGLVILVLAGVALLGIEVNLPGDPKKVEVTAMSLNVHFANRRLPKALEYIRKQQVDLLLLQENKGDGASPAKWLAGKLGWNLVEADEVAILSRWPLGRAEVVPSKALQFRSLLAVEVQAPKPFTAATVHWSSPQYLRGVEEMRRGARRQTTDFHQTLAMISSIKGPLILGGDFNNPPHHKHMRSLSSRLENSFGARGYGLGWTFHRKLPLVRIDHILVGGGMKTETCHVGPSLDSDHLPLVAGLSLGE